MFGVSVVWYLFLAGTGGGVSLATCAVDAFSNSRPALLKRVRNHIAVGFLAGLVLVTVGGMFLVADLGRPERVLNVFLYPGLNIMSFGVFAITTFIVSSSAQLYVRCVLRSNIPRCVYALLKWICAISAFAVVAYTGFLMKAWSGVKFWNTLLLPALFVASSLGAGIGLFSVLGLFVTGADCVAMRFRFLRNADIAFLVVEILALVGYLYEMWYDTSTVGAVWAMMAGSLSAPFWICSVAGGVCIPLVLSALSYRFPTSSLQAVSAVCALTGSFALRYCIVFAPFA